MNTKRLLGLATVVLTIALFASCKKSNNASGITANAQFALSLGSDSTSVGITATGSNNISANSISANGSPTATANVVITSGTANVSSFKIEATKNGKPVEFVTQNANNIDLFSANPTAIAAVLDTGTYTNVEIRIKLAKSTTLIPLILKGTYTSFGGAVVPLEINFNDDTEIKIAIKEKIVIDGKSDLATALKMHLNRLFAGISSGDVDRAARTGGVILISNSLNGVIYNKIVSNIVTAAGQFGVQIRGR